MTDIEQQARERFEAFAGDRLLIHWIPEFGSYASKATQEAWDLWQAAIASQAQAPAVPDDVQRNAERYLWLKRNCVREWESDMAHNRGAPSLDIEFEASGHDLDAAIDAAMLAAAPAPEVSR